MFGFGKNKKSYPVQKRQSRLPMFRPAGTRFLDAAKVDALNAGWTTTCVSADTIIRQQVYRVRARSRYLCMNDPYFARAIKLHKENVIGASGIMLQMRIVKGLLPDGSVEEDEGANLLIEDAWKRWCKKRYCTYDGMDSFLTVQNMAMQNIFIDGEIFIRKHRESNNPFGFSLELIEADHVPLDLNKRLENGNHIRMGIEYNPRNQVVAYHVLELHPGDTVLGQRKNSKTMRIPADRMVHLFLRERPSQRRGIPWGVSSMARAKMLDGYEQAELTAARAGASKMGFFKTKDGENYVGDDEVIDNNGNKVAITDFDPGTFEQLPDGIEFQAFDPSYPSGGFEMFTKRILRGIFSGLGIGYNTAANDYEGVNYSSLRQSNLSERDYYKCTQTFMIEQLHDAIFNDWLLMSITAGAVKLPIERLVDYDAASWRARGWTWVDPLKEVKAHKESVDMGITSLTRICAEQGVEYEDVLRDKAREMRLREKYSITEPKAGSTLSDEVIKELTQEDDDA